MLLPEMPPTVLDYRKNLMVDGVEIQAGTPLYTVVSRRSHGSSGPYFLDSGRALIWGFYAGIVNQDVLPIQRFHESVFNPQNYDPSPFFHGQYLFSRDLVLLEITSESTVIFDSALLDADIQSYVVYKYGRHDPTVKKTHMNYDDQHTSLIVSQFTNSKSWSQKAPALSYYSLLTMTEPWIYGHSQWIAKDNQGLLDVANSLRQFNHQHFAASTANDATAEKAFGQITEVGIRISRPQEIFEKRAVYGVNWAAVWLHFLRCRERNFSPAMVREVFMRDYASLLSEREEVPPFPSFQFGSAVVTIIAQYCHSLRDIISLCSVNRRLRAVMTENATVKKIIMSRFTPRWSEHFSLLPDQYSPNRRFRLGLPVKSNFGERWWKTGCVFFYEDLPNDGVTGEEALNRTASAQLRFKDSMPTEKPAKAAPKGLSMIEMDRDVFWHLDLPSHAVLPLMRGCNSFIAMFSTIYTLQEKSTLPNQVDISIMFNDKIGHFKLSTNRVARMPEIIMPRNTVFEILNNKPQFSYESTVNDITMARSWLHDFVCPFFLDPSFPRHLEAAKRIALSTPIHQRRSYNVGLVLLSADRLLVHIKIRMPTDGKELLLECYYPSSAADATDIDHYTWSNDMLKAYAIEGGFRFNAGRYTIPDDYSVTEFSEETNGIILATLMNGCHRAQYQWGSYTLDGLNKRKAGVTNLNNGYFAAYMYLCSLIRYLVYTEQGDKAEWSFGSS